MKPMLGLTATLLTFWLLLSGHYTMLLLSFGAISVALVAWLLHRMDVVDHEAPHLDVGLRAPAYWLWLGGQILRSAWDTSRRIWSPKLPINPVTGRTSCEGLSAVKQVTYANSLTLTPGTLATSVDDASIEVHALHPDTLRGLEDGRMVARVRLMGDS